MNIGVFGGSFDPVHNGHVALAQFVLAHSSLDEVWLMVSPENPLKPLGTVASDVQRLLMARLAVQDLEFIHASDFEFSLPVPSFSWLTLSKLREAFPLDSFRLIIGGDNWHAFHRWKNPDQIIRDFGLIVYPRPGEIIPTPPENVEVLDSAPLMKVSSTEIRRLLLDIDNPANFARLCDSLPPRVLSHILASNLYQS